jgi:hypothetical protein
MAGLLQLGGEDFTGLVGLGRARRGLVCPCCFVRSAAVKTAGGGRPVEVVPSRRQWCATPGPAVSLFFL